MAVLIYIESPKGKIKKTGFEVAYYGSKLAASQGTDCIALLIGKTDNAGSPGKYGVNKVIHVNADQEIDFDSQSYTSIITQIVSEYDVETTILANTANGKTLTGRLAIRLEAGSVSGANSLPDLTDGFVVNKSVYSGKAIVKYAIETKKKVISVMGNTLQPQITGESVVPQNVTIPSSASKLKVLESKKTEVITPLPEA